MSTKPQHYRLQWNNYQTHITELFAQLLHTSSLVDVTLCVEGEKLQAHRIILSACSSYFQEMLANVEEGHPIVILGDMSSEDIRCIIEFIYRGELSVSAERVASVLEVARELKIRGLMEVGKHVLEMEAEGTQVIDEEMPTAESVCEKQSVDVNPQIYEEDSGTVDIVINNAPEDMPVSQKPCQTHHLEVEGTQIAEKIEEEDHKRKRRRDSSKKNYNEVIMTEALDELRAGRTLLETSASHHIPRSTLYFRARAQGVPLTITRQEHSLEKIRAAVQAVSGGASLQQAAKLYSIPKTVLWRRVQKEVGRGTLVHRPRLKHQNDIERRQAAVKALENGENLSKVSNQFQIPKTTLFREKHRLVEAGRLPWSCLRKRNHGFDWYKQHRLTEAVAACKQGKMSQAAASIVYKVPKTTIWRRLRQVPRMDSKSLEETQLESTQLVEESVQDLDESVLYVEGLEESVSYEDQQSQQQENQEEGFGTVEGHIHYNGEEIVETMEVPQNEVTSAISHLQSESQFAIVGQVPVTYIDESEYPESSLIILSTNDSNSVSLPSDGEQLIVETSAEEVE